MDYKINKYTQFIVDGNNTILFNLQDDGFIILNSELAEVVNKNKDSIDMLEKMHPALFAELQKKGIIIPKETDEVKDLVEKWKKADNDPTHFSMIVNPTLGCNLRCWYCYEEHDKKPVMKAEVLESICRLIDKKLADPVLKNLNVSFGGEPLVGLKQVVLPLLEYAGKACKKRGVLLSSSFTTNGVLLTDEVLDALENVGLTSPATFQISLDGNKDYHNRSRVGVNLAPTYDIIVGNMINAAKRGHSIFARLNYTAGNAGTFMDVLDDFQKLPAETKKYIQFNFQQIWQDIANDIHERIDNMKEAYRGEGFSVESDHICHRHSCYADKENSIVINYDGNLFKCTARDFHAENREGQLNTDGEIVWNERYYNRMNAKYSNKACLECKILPICNGGCSQGKIESKEKDSCYEGISEEEKEVKILNRLKELITLQNLKNSHKA